MTETAVREPWPNLAMQREGVSLGMWTFLASEALFFAGLFASYAVYRSFNQEAFAIASAHTQVLYGSINTALLLTSSFTITIALRAASAELRSLMLSCLAVTAALGLAFLACKGLEYREDLREHLFPGPNFPLSPPATRIFWGLYWVTTVVHAIHLSVGIGAVLVTLVAFQKRLIPPQGATMEGIALYWHFVDCIWIVLFPLLYLGGRS
jgi:cytochrome c oxidase subunit III